MQDLMMDKSSWEMLHRVAKQMLLHSYSPYSKYPVGAAAYTRDGLILYGTNVENASYGLTLCAECSLVSQLFTSGGERLKALWCVGGEQGETILPCGRCRQLLYEHGGGGMLIMSPDGPIELGELLPQAFSKENLA